MKLKKIENALELTWDELHAACVAVTCADGNVYKPVFGFKEGLEYVSLQGRMEMVVPMHVLPLVGWTFWTRPRTHMESVEWPEGDLTITVPEKFRGTRFTVTFTEEIDHLPDAGKMVEGVN